MAKDANGNWNLSVANPSYIVPVGDLSLAERNQIRMNARQQALNLFMEARIATDENQAVVRDGLPFTDFGLTGGTSGNEWLITGAGTAGTEINYINALQLTTTQTCSFYGIGSPMATPNIGRVRFFLGPASATVRQVVQLEKLYSRLEQVGYLGTPVSYNPQAVITVGATPFNAFAANTERLTLLVVVCDKIGTTVSGPTI